MIHNIYNLFAEMKKRKESQKEIIEGHYDQYNGCPHNKNETVSLNP